LRETKKKSITVSLFLSVVLGMFSKADFSGSGTIVSQLSSLTERRNLSWYLSVSSDWDMKFSGLVSVF
jgi:hypothetical protein